MRVASQGLMPGWIQSNCLSPRLFCRSCFLDAWQSLMRALRCMTLASSSQLQVLTSQLSHLTRQQVFPPCLMESRIFSTQQYLPSSSTPQLSFSSFFMLNLFLSIPPKQNSNSPLPIKQPETTILNKHPTNHIKKLILADPHGHPINSTLNMFLTTSLPTGYQNHHQISPLNVEKTTLPNALASVSLFYEISRECSFSRLGYYYFHSCPYQVEMSAGNRLQEEQFDRRGQANFVRRQAANSPIQMLRKGTNLLKLASLAVAIILLLVLFRISSLKTASEQTLAEIDQKISVLKEEAIANQGKFKQSTFVSPRSKRTVDERRKSLEAVSIPIPVRPAGEGTNREREYETAHLPNSEHRDSLSRQHYATVAMAPEQYFNDTRVAGDQLVQFDQQILSLLHPYTDTDCQQARFGSPEEGGYILCKNYLSQSEALLNIGIQGEDEMACEVTSSFPMPNYQFSCTRTTGPSCSTNGGLNYFERVCASENSQSNGEDTFYSMQDILKHRGLYGKNIILKLNQFESSALKNCPLQFIAHFDQVVIDLHFDSDTDLWGQLDIVKGLTSLMLPVNLHSSNGACLNHDSSPSRGLTSGTLQVTLVNKGLITKHSQSRSFSESPLNSPNFPNNPSCSQPAI